MSDFPQPPPGFVALPAPSSGPAPPPGFVMQGAPQAAAPDYAAMPWLDVAKSAAMNAPESAGNFARDIVQPILHPIDTAKTLGKLGMGAVQKVIPGEQEYEPMADAVGQFFADRYGSMEGFKRALATDPVGILGDLSTVFTGGGMAAAKAPGMVGRAAQAARVAGDMMDPLSMAGKAVGKTVSMTGEGAAHLIGGLGTHTGADSIKAAYRAGKEGGATADAFRANMRGEVPLEQVVADAKTGVANMRQARGDAYRAGMTGIAADNTVLDFAPIDAALGKAREVGTFEGKVLNRSAQGVMDDIAKIVEDWRGSDPAIYHTPQGLDALKKAIGDARDSTQYGTPSRVAADRVYNAVREQVATQAPEYAKVMKDYETASDLLSEVEKTLSLNPKANIDTTLRKLQSVMRNNVNTNYGRRGELVSELEAAGAGDINAKLAGQALNSMTPRGLGRAVGGATVASGMALNPALLATLPFQSPRLMGEAAYYTGKVAGGAGDVAERLRLEKMLQAAKDYGVSQEMFQAGRAGQEDNKGRLTRMLLQPVRNQ